MKEYTLKTAQPGFAVGEAFRPGPGSGTEVRRAADPAAEQARLDTAVSALKEQLAAAAEKDTKENAAIYGAQQLFLEDKDFIGAAQIRIEKDGVGAETAVREAGEALAGRFEENENTYIRERSSDIRGLTDRLIRTMSGAEEKTLCKPSILVAEELSPAGIASLDQSLIRGIVTAKGAPASHVSILAGNLGIPYLYGSEEAVEAIAEGDCLILDGEKLIHDPAADILQAAYERAAGIEAEKKDSRTQQAAQGIVTRTKIYANIAGPQEIEALLASGAEGVGLFRSEFLFLDRTTEPTEEEQFQAYRRVAEAMGGKETVIRTMDIGSDKKVGWLDLPEEKNPALGCRGVRVSLSDESLFHAQLRALLRAAAFGNVKIMVPMITSPWEVEAVRAQIGACAKELAAEGTAYRVPPLGIMIETPAAVMVAEELAEISAFFSIGTNDLTQYTLALDREAQGLERYYDPCHEAVLRLIERTAEAGHKKNIPVAICGELAGNPAAVRRLIEAGMDELSVSVKKVGATREAALCAEQEIARKAEEAALCAEQETARKAEETALCAEQKTGQPQEAAVREIRETAGGQKESPAAGAVSAPADGELIPMEEIPDPAFSSGSLGKCIGVLPENGSVYAPCDGTVTSVAATGHAITFAASDGREILLHAGIDTVKMGGRGFTVLVREGDTVRAGQEVLQMDPDQIRAAGLSPMVIVCLL